MATPALELLCSHVGREKLHLLALRRGIHEMAQASGYFSEVHLWDPDSMPLVDGLRLLRYLRSERFDHSVSFFPSGDWKFAAFSRIVDARVRLGFRYPHSRWPARVQHCSVSIQAGTHDIDQNLRLIETLTGVSRSGLEKPLVFGAPAQHFLKNDSVAYFVCHPGSSTRRGMECKRLPAASLAALINLIYQEFNLKAVLIGGAEEKGLRIEIQALARDAVEIHSPGNLSDSSAIIGKAQFFIGSDSGLMHLSAALGLSCIVFFGPTDEVRNGPYSSSALQRHLLVRRNDLDCAPCWNLGNVGSRPRCIYGDVRCLRDLDISFEWPAIRNFIFSLGRVKPADEESGLPAEEKDLI